jgi:hypothetical protein
MRKLAPLALTACLGFAAAALSLPAQAGAYVGIGVGVPEVVVAPPAVAYPSYYAGPRYFHPGYVRYGYGFGGHYGYRYGYRSGFGHGHYHGRPWR